MESHNRPHSDTDLEAFLQSGYGYAFSLTHDASRAEDLVQEACIKLLDRQLPWHKGYFFATIRNRFIEIYRRKMKFPTESLSDLGYQATAAIQVETGDPEKIVADKESLDRALAMLKPEEREVLYLSVVEGYSAKELADLTGRPRNTILSLIHRIKNKLRTLLADERRKHGHE